LFGFEFKRKSPQDVNSSFVPPQTDDGAAVVSATGSYGTYLDLDGTVRTEAELVTKYREMALQPEVDTAIDEIVNEMVAIDEPDIVRIILDNLNIQPNTKKIIEAEFKNVLNILDFERHAYEIARRWYTDGRMYYHVVIDEKNPREGIKELRYIDPRKIRKIREVNKKRVKGGEQGDAIIQKIQNEYFVFNDRGFNYGNKSVGPSTTGLRIAKDSIVYVTSGLTDTQGTMVLSYLHKGIKALNQLRTLEDSLVIYRLARAPERRIWYIDIGNLPKMKAEQYVREIMVKHKNRLIYDGNSGEIRDDRKFMTMLEDYWIPRREGGKGTEVTTLPGGQNLGQMDDVLYFQKKLYQTLNVPVNRLNSDAMFSLGRATEVTRDEVKFFKFISRLRSRFAALFGEILGKQLVLKGLMTIEDWNNISPDIKFDFAKDNHFTELKDTEVLSNRIQAFMMMQPLLGAFYSRTWAMKNILQMSDEDIEEMREQIIAEMNDPIFNPQVDENGQPVQQEDDGGQPPPSDDGSASDSRGDKIKKIAQARATYNLLMKKTDKTKKDEEILKSVSQIVAKNK
jgi:hypothetical protein